MDFEEPYFGELKKRQSLNAITADLDNLKSLSNKPKIFFAVG